ncbi:MAG: isochorismatase family protein, partial [Nitrososphaerales archaeon]
SNVCVEKAIIGFYLRGFDVFVPVDCVSAKNTYAQEWALRQFVDFYRAKITRSDLITLRATDAIVEKAYVAP